MGPACNSKEKIEQLIDAGMNVARINFSHGTHEQHKQTIDRLKEARKAKGVPLAIMLDTKGPEIRAVAVQGGEIELNKGEKYTLQPDHQLPKSEREISIYPDLVIDQLEEGMVVLFDDGKIETVVVEKKGNSAIIECLTSGSLKNQKGVNIPHGNIALPHITEKDKEDIRFGCEQDVDIIAASFVCDAQHVLDIKRLIAEHNQPHIHIMSKIESFSGVQNFDSIVHVSDGIMVARGDLGVEMPIEQVPKLQKEFILKCYQVGKPVAIATQMLESMMQSPTPTRAEVSDVANAIYDSASCVMLSGETAVGKYPILTVQTMRRVIDESEKEFKYRDYFFHQLRKNFYDVPSAVSAATVKTCYSAAAKGIIICTMNGMTARSISRFRPGLPILALTPSPKTYNQLAMNWGIIPIHQKASTVSEAIHHVSEYAIERGILSYGDLIVVTAGSPFNVSGSTNMMIVDIIGDVLVRGEGHGEGQTIHGQVAIALSANDEALYDAKNKILILSSCNYDYAKLIENSMGVILQNHPEDAESEAIALELAAKNDLPIITRADNALAILQKDQFITMKAKEGIVFKGSLNGDQPNKSCKYHQF